ncbi:MAG TPA: glycosyltransferase family 2 protein [Candidatus Eisenbacteria bacterium]|nr:glycosyltransferase family 2 protein [Candidatus Eisenbacteria bacterium]
MTEPAPVRHPEPRHARLLSVVVPTMNEEVVLDEFHSRVSAVLGKLPLRSEIVYINDGSTDGTLGVMKRLRSHDPRVAIVDLSRNFGKEIALTAGLDHAKGDVVVIIDADLQDPPELIPELLAGYGEGFDVVYAQRRVREGETWFKKATAFAFYRVIQRLTRVKIPADTGDFRLLSRRALDSLQALREQHRFMKGLYAWVGYPQKAVPYDRSPRHAGQTKWNYWGLWNFAIEGITSFSTAPLKLASYLGILVAVGALLYAIWIVYKTIAFGEDVRGYPSLMVVILFLGGVQLVTIGILGEYLGRMFDETKRRPLYFVTEYAPAADPEPGA